MGHCLLNCILKDMISPSGNVSAGEKKDMSRIWLTSRALYGMAVLINCQLQIGLSPMMNNMLHILISVFDVIWVIY